MSKSSTLKPPVAQFSVLVVGGGVSGLTAAHELAERGFEVYLVEKAFGPSKASGRERLQLGGMARTQYAVGSEQHQLPSEHAAKAPPPLLPGEHGFRFFPSYYSHVFNTMQHIPLYEKRKGRLRATGRTVYDNVEPCRTVATGVAGGTPYVMDRAKPTSIAEFVDRMRILFEAGYQPLDIDIYLARLMRYMCTCPDRRAATCEDVSFYDYLVGREPGSSVDRYHFSAEFLDNIKSMPKVLAAFDAVWGDARTNWSTMAQLVANEMQDMPKLDGVLNGPTSDAWIEPWRRHLKALGVTFVHGKVDHFELEDGVPRPVFDGKLSGRKGADLDEAVIQALQRTDYTVIALDAPAAQEVTSTLPPIGVPAQLQSFVWDIAEPARGTQAGESRRRDPYTESGRVPWDRFQTLTGIQFFFDRYIRVAHGHIYMPGTKWALSSIFEQDFWTERPRLKRDGYLTLLSVDVGAWNTPSAFTGLSANESTREQLALEIWRQSREALGSLEASELPDPHWFHVDTNIVYDDKEPFLPVRNDCPYLIPIVGEFPRRPGAAPWNPAGAAAPCEPAQPGVWQAGHGGYLVHWESMVFAGTYKKTFTRMTTMEAACESGRHAVNAIIDHCNRRLTGTERGAPGQQWQVPVGFRTERNLQPVYEPTPIADYCQIYEMEANEVADLAFAKTIDQWFFDRKLPHPWEVLGLDALVSHASRAGTGALPPGAAGLSELLGKLALGGLDPRGAGMAAAAQVESYLPVLLETLQKLRSAVEKAVAEGRAGPPPPPA